MAPHQEPATLVVLKLVLSKARKNATVPASALPNAAADALADKDAKTEPVHMFTMMFAPAVSSI